MYVKGQTYNVLESIQGSQGTDPKSSWEILDLPGKRLIELTNDHFRIKMTLMTHKLWVKIGELHLKWSPKYFNWVESEIGQITGSKNSSPRTEIQNISKWPFIIGNSSSINSYLFLKEPFQKFRKLLIEIKIEYFLYWSWNLWKDR